MTSYFDFNSTSRNRSLNSNPTHFSIASNNSNRDITDLILDSTPYTGSDNNLNYTQTSIDVYHIKLDPAEIEIDNYYKDSNLEINGESHNIEFYDGTSKIATMSEPFTFLPNPNTFYEIRKSKTYFSTNVGIISENKLNILNPDFSSNISNLYSGSYITFTNGSYKDQTAVITNYSPNDNDTTFIQESNPGKNLFLDSNVEYGFLFYPNSSGLLTSIILNLIVFDSILLNRTLKFKILNGKNLSSPILYVHNFTISNTLRNNVGFNLTNPIALTGNNPYVLVVSDITNTSNGYVNMFGIQSNDFLKSFNSDFYPTLDINLVGSGGNNSLWSQSQDNNHSDYIPVDREAMVKFKSNYSNNLDRITLRMQAVDFNNSNTRTLSLKILENGNPIFQNTYELTNASNLDKIYKKDYMLDVTSVSLIQNNEYVLCLQDLTINGNGFINIFGIKPDLTHQSDLNVYPKVLLETLSIITQQPDIEPIVRLNLDGNESGFLFKSKLTGLLNSITIPLGTDNINASTDFQIRIREGAGVSGNIIYDKTITGFTTDAKRFEFITVDYEIIPEYSVPVVLNNFYTLTIQVLNDSLGFKGIESDGIEYVSYNNDYYPKLLILYKRDENILFDQNVENGFELYLEPKDFTGDSKIGFNIQPDRTSVVSSVTLTLSCFDSLQSERLLQIDICDGLSLTGNVIYSTSVAISKNPQKDVTILLDNPPTLIKNNNYTLILYDVTTNPYDGFFILYGIEVNSFYDSYNNYNTNPPQNVYPKLSLNIEGSITTFSQKENPTILESISKITEQSFIFKPFYSGKISNIILCLSSYEGVLDGRKISLNIREGRNGKTDPSLYNQIYTIENTYQRKDYTFNIISGPNLMSNRYYSIGVEDVTGSEDGQIYVYGISNSSYYQSNNIGLFPRMLIEIPSFIIEISPSYNLDGFLKDDTDNIEFSTRPRENSSVLLKSNNYSVKNENYKIQLEFINVPNREISSGYGGTLSNYPYFYVQIGENGINNQISSFMTNNPNSRSAVFKIPIEKKTNQYFFTFKNIGIQNIKTSLDQNPQIGLYLPNGEPITWKKSDLISPSAPDPLLQIHALVSITPS